MQQGLGKDFKDSEMLDAGTWIAGQYQIVELIGIGGMGSVYKCMDRLTNRLVATKVLRRDLTLNSKAVQRFQREAQAIASLEHQNIVKLYNFQSDGQTPMLIMEYVEGIPLNKLLEDQGSLKLKRAVDITIQISDALSYAHIAGIIHRDLKPSNIIIKQNPDGSETAKLVDFGIAKINDAQSNMTATGEIFGSPGYMSPEQSTGQMISESADQYALGCVLFECLTGSRPFISDTPLAVVMQHIKDLPPTLKEASLGNQFPAELEMIVQRMLEKEPARRFASMLVVRDALSGKKVEAALPALSASKPGQTTEKPKQAISSALTGAGVTLLLVALLAGGWFLFHQETAPVVIATTQPTHTTQSAQSTQSTESAQSIQSAQSTESAQSTHSAQPPETAQSKEKAADESSLPAADLSSTQDHNFAQKLFKEHLWRHRTAKFVELPDDRYPRMGSLSTDAVKTISDMNAVIKVDLSGFKDTAYLIDLKSTTLLDLNLATTDVSDTTVEHFGTNLPNLQKLELGDSQQLKAFSLKSRSLKSLDLSATNISDAVLKSLRTPNLQDLSLRNCKKLTDTGFASLANLGSLRKLNVNETSISDSSIGHLSSLPHLEELTLGKYSNLTDHCLVEIAKLPHLTHLNMRGIDPKGKLSLLRKLRNLQWLGLASTTLTDEDLADIAQLPQLKEVDLTKASFSDKGYSKLVENTPHLVKLRNAPDEDLDPQAENIRSHRKLKQIPPSY